MRDPKVLGWVLLGTLPFLLFGTFHFGTTLARVVDPDPCMTWGTSWDSYQEGGGTSGFGPDREPLDPECPQGRTWTTEAPGHALWKIAWWPAFGLAAFALGLVAWWRGRAWPLAGATAFVAAGGLPLTLGFTVFVAFLPAAAVMAGAREMTWTRAETAAFRTVGAMAAAFAIFGAVMSVSAVAKGDMPPVALVGAAAVLAQFALVAVLGLAPQASRLPASDVAPAR